MIMLDAEGSELSVGDEIVFFRLPKMRRAYITSFHTDGISVWCDTEDFDSVKFDTIQSSGCFLWRSVNVQT